MLTSDQTQSIQHLVTEAKSILVIYAKEASEDQVAAAVALHLGLVALGKNSSLLSPTKPGKSLAHLEGISQVSTEMGNKNLEISFDYQEDMVDKVSYNIDEQLKKFRLLIQPRQNAKPLDAKTVEFAYVGAEAEVIFLVGVAALDDLDRLYVGYEQLYEDAKTISLNTFETPFGLIKVSTAGAASTSEVMAYLIQQLGAELTDQIATNLITGIEVATDHLQSLSATADTFEIISQLLRAGGRRVNRGRAKLEDSPKVITDGTSGFANAVSRVSKVELKKMSK